MRPASKAILVRALTKIWIALHKDSVPVLEIEQSNLNGAAQGISTSANIPDDNISKNQISKQSLQDDTKDQLIQDKPLFDRMNQYLRENPNIYCKILRYEVFSIKSE